MFRHARVGEETRRRRCEMGNISLRDRDTVTAAERGREFWRGVLLAGGFTGVPRWTLDPVPGIAEHEAKICNEVVAALPRLAGGDGGRGKLGEPYRHAQVVRGRAR